MDPEFLKSRDYMMISFTIGINRISVLILKAITLSSRIKLTADFSTST